VAEKLFFEIYFMTSKTWSALAFLLLLHLAFTQVLHAAPNPISTTVTICDEISLRAAVSNGGTIHFGCDGTIELSSTLQITIDTVLDATGHNVVLSGRNAVRLFFVSTNVNFAITNLTIANGKQQGTNVAGSDIGESVFGAGIFNSGGHLTLVGCVLSNNTAVAGFGGFSGQNVLANGGNSLGAAIYNDRGSIWMSNCLLSMNLCQSGAERWEADASVGGIASGGGVYSTNGSVDIYDSTFENNTVLGGTGYNNNVPYWLPGSGAGGALYVEGGTLSIMHAQFSNNQALGGSVLVFQQRTSGSGQGGALFLTNCSASASSSRFLTNHAASGSVGRYGAVGQAQGGAVFNAADLVLDEDLFTQNRSAGGVGNAQDQVNGGGEAHGGAIWNLASISARRTAWTENEAIGGRGSGVFSVPAPGGAGKGGALYNVGIFTVAESTLASNQAVGGDGQRAPTAGGDLILDRGGNGEGGAVFNQGQFSATNISVFSNRAQGGQVDVPDTNARGGDGNGGGFYNIATLSLVHATVASNGAIVTGHTNNPGIERGGGIFTTNNSSPVLRNSIIANSPSGGNAFGVLIDDGNNISSDSTCQFTAPGSLNNTDPLLSDLGAFGGPTQTIALLAGSPAIDRALAIYSVSTDQRGVRRPIGSASDIGAFEFGPFVNPLDSMTIAGYTNQVLHLSFVTANDRTYQVQTTIDLTSWVNFGSKTTGTNGVFDFSYTNILSEPSRFFRMFGF
jgi:hypothetical protein